MKNLSLFTLAVLSLLFIAGCGGSAKKELTPEEKVQKAKLAAALPFEVTIAGDKALLNTEFCAKIANPVDAVAEISVEAKSNDIIVASIYESDAEGIAQAGKKPFIVLIGKDGKSALNKTSDGKKLKPGFYVMNINADNQIASVLFEIKK